jgi:hypothetical protein
LAGAHVAMGAVDLSKTKIENIYQIEYFKKI